MFTKPVSSTEYNAIIRNANMCLTAAESGLAAAYELENTVLLLEGFTSNAVLKDINPGSTEHTQSIVDTIIALNMPRPYVLTRFDKSMAWLGFDSPNIKADRIQRETSQLEVETKVSHALNERTALAVSSVREQLELAANSIEHDLYVTFDDNGTATYSYPDVEFLNDKTAGLKLVPKSQEVNFSVTLRRDRFSMAISDLEKKLAKLATLTASAKSTLTFAARDAIIHVPTDLDGILRDVISPIGTMRHELLGLRRTVEQIEVQLTN